MNVLAECSFHQSRQTFTMTTWKVINTLLYEIKLLQLRITFKIKLRILKWIFCQIM